MRGGRRKSRRRPHVILVAELAEKQKPISGKPDDRRQKQHGTDVGKSADTTGRARDDRANNGDAKRQRNHKQDEQDERPWIAKNKSGDVDECFAGQTAPAVHDRDHEMGDHGHEYDEQHQNKPDAN